jgi:hypothetical protein
MDRNGQEFTDSAKNWKPGFPCPGCIITSSGNYEERGFKILALRGGDSKLFFIREQKTS